MKKKNIAAKISALLGLLGLIEVMLLIIEFAFAHTVSQTRFVIVYVYFGAYFFYTGWIFDLSSLIFGIIGLKSEKGIFAKTGITLSVLGLLGYLLLFIFLVQRFG